MKCRRQETKMTGDQFAAKIRSMFPGATYGDIREILISHTAWPCTFGPYIVMQMRKFRRRVKRWHKWERYVREVLRKEPSK